ncbi:hypothetical protein DXG01_004325 [Tephrocybe rancida]|nr:hypothetical protein DXG01_004325 [Tephrocybe rancida]
MPGIIGQPTFGNMDELLSAEKSKAELTDPQDDKPALPVNPAHLPHPSNMEIIDPQHVPWIRPPDIVHHRGGTWERFTESIDNSRMDCMRKISKSDELGKSPLKQDFAVKIIRLTKDELPRCQNENAPPKLVPLFSSADSEDEDGDSYVECVSDHEDDLLPIILQQKAMAEAKSAQEEYAPKNPLPLTTPTIEEIAPTTSQMTTSPSQTPSKDTAKKTPPPTPMIKETAPITS